MPGPPGVNGKQRGTSRREDALDLVIGLRRPADYSAEQGARFEVHIEKARTLVGDGALPFEAMVEAFVSESGRAGIRWVARDLNRPSCIGRPNCSGTAIPFAKLLTCSGLAALRRAAFALGRPLMGFWRGWGG